MALLPNGLAKTGAVAGFYPQTINQSLRFEDDDGAYLSRTPTSAGNRKTFTWSGWVKVGNTDSYNSLFSAGSSGSAYASIWFNAGDLVAFSYNGGTVFNLTTNAVFRDPSAWYHVVWSVDTTQATASNRMKLYVNGEQITSFSSSTYPSQNLDTYINSTIQHRVGWSEGGVDEFDGYMAEIHFTDGTAYTADDFGELKSGIWVPKADVSTTVTYGTNGFYLPFNEDVTVEGFNAVTWRGNNDSRSVTGVGFQPDFVWIKNRSDAWDHVLVDSIRGGSAVLSSKDADAEADPNPRGYLTSFDSDGFSLTNGSSGDEQVNDSGDSYVAWCWDAGSGSPVSNTDGSITSTVKANTDYGFSIVGYTGNGTAGATIGHGLNQAPDFVIIKNRDSTLFWNVQLEAGKHLYLNATNAEIANSDRITAFGASTLTLGNNTAVNTNTDNHIAYCFHSVSGYSDFGTYTGNGLADDSGPTVTTGFKPALVIYKQSSGTGNWSMVDNTRSPEPVADNLLNPNLSNAENTSDEWIKFTDTGFQVRNTHSDQNANGATYIYMAFADTRDAAFWLDESGNDNDWTHNNLEHSDVVPDSPTNNFAVLNPLTSTTSASFKEGNLYIDIGNTPYGLTYSTIGIDSGKWYFEILWISGVPTVGLNAGNSDDDVLAETDGIRYNSSNGNVLIDNVSQGTFTDWDSSGVVVGVAINADDDEVSFYRNNTLITTQSFTFDKTYFPAVSDTSTSNPADAILNFGQDSTFAGNKTAGGNSDANGIGDFAYAPPSGYLALCTANLPDPAIDPAQEATADQHFNVYTYVGNGASQLIGDVVREIPDTYPISQSLRFEDGDSAYLNFQDSGDSAGRYNWTFSFWFKRGNLGSKMRVFATQMVANPFSGIDIKFNASNQLAILEYAGVGGFYWGITTRQQFNDPDTWHHVVLTVDTTQATSTDRAKLFIDGIRVSDADLTQTALSATKYPTLNYEEPLNRQSNKYISHHTSEFYDGYMAEWHFIDNSSYDADTFGVFDADGLWRPIEPSVTYGTNGFHLDFADSADIGDDNSGNTNDFTVNNLVASDVVIDTPTNSFVTLSSVDLIANNGYLAEGNLLIADATSNYTTNTRGTSEVRSGKWYYEVYNPSAVNQITAGWIANDTVRSGNAFTSFTNGPPSAAVGGYSTLGYSSENNGATFNLLAGSTGFNTTGQVLGIAYDADEGKLYFSIDGVYQNSGNPAAGTGWLVSHDDPQIGYRPFLYVVGGGSAQQAIVNFGQDSTYAGNETAASNADANGYGEFQYAPPSGFLALCENNLIQYDDNPLESPDFVWIKTRSAVVDHRIFDSVRGVNVALRSNTTSTEATEVGSLTSFNKNGFTIGNHASVNTSGSTYVAWAWKAGGTAVANTDGSINSQVSANTDAGFSIVAYTGNATAGATVGHGLSSTPEMIIVKERTNDGGWWSVYHKDSTATGTAADTYLQLNATATSASWNGWNDTPPTASVFSLGNYDDVNGPSDTYIAYCFHSVDGFSKCGSYIGNGSADGPFVYTGHRSRFLLVKRTNGSASSWYIWDTERDPDNQAGLVLLPNSSGAEIDYTSTSPFDFLSNGFKVRATAAAFNNSGNTYVFYSAAEQPFKYSNAR